MADNLYAKRRLFSGWVPAVVRYRFRFAAARDEADLADLQSWWLDMIGLRGVCLPAAYARWIAVYLLAAALGVGLAAWCLLVAQSLVAAMLVLVATGMVFGLLWLVPPALLVVDRHGIWITRQLRTGYVPWVTLREIRHDAASDAVQLAFKAGVVPRETTCLFVLRRLRPSRAPLGVGFARLVQAEPKGDAVERWRLTAQPAGLASAELAQLLRWALDEHGTPLAQPQRLVDRTAPETRMVDESEFDRI